MKERVQGVSLFFGHRPELLLIAAVNMGLKMVVILFFILFFFWEGGALIGLLYFTIMLTSNFDFVLFLGVLDLPRSAVCCNAS